MTFSDFKAELYMLRNNKREIRSLLLSLAKYEEENFAKLNTGVVNYAGEHVQTSHDPDKALINVIDMNMRERERTLEKLRDIREVNQVYEDMIFAVAGITGEVLRKYFIEGMTMPMISQHVSYSEAYCWQLLKNGIKDLYKKEASK